MLVFKIHIILNLLEYILELFKCIANIYGTIWADSGQSSTQYAIKRLHLRAWYSIKHQMHTANTPNPVD